MALGRSNWTFLGSDRGGRTMAVLRSFVSSCELVKVDPFAFRDVLSRIATHSLQKLEDLLPHRWAASHPSNSSPHTLFEYVILGVHVMHTTW